MVLLCLSCTFNYVGNFKTNVCLSESNIFAQYAIHAPYARDKHNKQKQKHAY